MSLTKLANAYLEYMVREYSTTHKKVFSDWNAFQSMFPDEDADFICDALQKLKNDGLIDITWADNLPCLITLDLNAIIQAEENTPLKKTYKFLKELREWL